MYQSQSIYVCTCYFANHLVAIFYLDLMTCLLPVDKVIFKNDQDSNQNMSKESEEINKKKLQFQPHKILPCVVVREIQNHLLRKLKTKNAFFKY